MRKIRKVKCPRSHSWLLSRRPSPRATTPSWASNLPLTLLLCPHEDCLLTGVWLLADSVIQKGRLTVCMQGIARDDGKMRGVGVRWMQIPASPLAAL